MKKLKLGFMISFVTLLMSCGGGPFGGGGPYVEPVSRVDDFLLMINDRYLFDSEYYLVKHPTATEGFVVVYSDDTGYVAYDIANFLVGDTWADYVSFREFEEVYVYDWETDIFGETFYYGDAYYADSGSYAGEFVFEQTQSFMKDVEKVGALKDIAQAQIIGKAMSAEFGLSEKRGLEVAKLVKAWKDISKKRELTESDANAFSQALGGFDIKDAELAAYKKEEENDKGLYNSLVKKAADLNGTTPEDMGKMIDQFVSSADK